MSIPSAGVSAGKGAKGVSRTKIEEIDARLQAALSERAKVEADSMSDTTTRYLPDCDADTMRQVVERHKGDLPLAVVEHLWRALICACTRLDRDTAIHLDGSADLVDMLDLARFYFGFAVDLVPGTDAEDVAGTVAASKCDLGIVALADRADLPWWRGLSETGAQVRARLPFLVLDDRPADLPALVLAKADCLVDKADVAVYDARWSERLPGRLMDQGIEVLSFFRSAGGVDALLAVSGDLPEEDVIKACSAAGAEPEVLRHVGGYATPIDGNSDAEDGFGPDMEDGSGDPVE